jgi:hypothetical protein
MLTVLYTCRNKGKRYIMTWNIYFTAYTWLTVLYTCMEYTETIYNDVKHLFCLLAVVTCDRGEYINSLRWLYILDMESIYGNMREQRQMNK